MNRDNAKDYLPLVQALAEGKVIQCQLDELLNWRDTASPDFTMAPECYRIKPEPREIWFNRYRTGVESGPFSTKEKALEYAFHDHPTVVVCYREVLE